MQDPQGTLGLVAEEQNRMDASTLAKLAAIAQIDLAFEKTSFVSRHPDERPYADLIERELKRFLSLLLFVPDPDYPFAPTVRVDELWHDFILNTPKYRSLCDHVYGAYLDHRPNQEELASQIGGRAAEMAEFTNSMLIKYFGTLEEAIWGEEIQRPCYPPPPAGPPS